MIRSNLNVCVTVTVGQSVRPPLWYIIANNYCSVQKLALKTEFQNSCQFLTPVSF